MRIAQVVRQFHPCVGGLERFTLDLSRQLAARGHAVEVITLDRGFGKPGRLPPRDAVDGLAVRRVPYLGWRGYPLAPGVLRGLRGYDVVHVHAVDFFADYLALTAPLHRRPLVLSTHGGYFHTPRLAPVKRLFFATVTPRTLRAYCRIVCNGREDFARFAPLAPERTRLVENAVDAARFAAGPRRPEAGRLLTLGRLAPNKRLDRLIRALAAGRRIEPRLRLDVVGEDRDGLRAELEALATALGVRDAVTLHGLLPDEAVGPLIERAQWFVSASEYEGFGLAAVEAMAAGLPPILSDIAAFRHLVRPGIDGALVAFADPAAAGAELARLARRDPAELRRLGEAARAAAARYAWPAVAAQFEAIYQEAIAGTPRATRHAHHRPPAPASPSAAPACPGGDEAACCGSAAGGRGTSVGPGAADQNSSDCTVAATGLDAARANRVSGAENASADPVELPPRSLRILGVRVDDVTNHEALGRLERLIEAGGPAQVVTVNPEFVMAARRLPAFRRTIERAALALPDGVGLLLAARLAGVRLRERVAGVDTCVALAGLAARRGWSIYLLGARDGVAEAAAERLRERFPALRVAGCYAGSPDEAEAAGIVRRVRASGATILLVAYGAPAQDLWLAHHLPETGAALGLGVGGAFDFISGRVPRAPRPVQRLGLEWLYRLVREPWRWRRQLALPRFLLIALWLARPWRRTPRGRDPSSPQPG